MLNFQENMKLKKKLHKKNCKEDIFTRKKRSLCHDVVGDVWSDLSAPAKKELKPPPKMFRKTMLANLPSTQCMSSQFLEVLG